MKTSYHKFATLLAACVVCTVLYGQEGQTVLDMQLSGKYTASCLIEAHGNNGIQFSDLCPTEFVADEGRIMDFEMTFTPDMLVLNQEGTEISVPYARNERNHSFSFALNDKEYDFRVFIDGTRRVIANEEDGMLLVLEQVED